MADDEAKEESVMLKNTRELTGSALLFVAGIYVFFFTGLMGVAFNFNYRPEAHSLLLFVRCFQPLLIFPCYWIALIPRWWATIPIWLVSISITLLPFLLDDQQKLLLGFRNEPFGFRYMKELLLMLVIPVVVQLAIFLKQPLKNKT